MSQQFQGVIALPAIAPAVGGVASVGVGVGHGVGVSVQTRKSLLADP
jgi:hypothetical protein